MFTVSGSVPPNANLCHVYLRTEAGDEVPFTRRAVSGDFSEQFPVTSCGATHQLIVTCDGMERKIVTAPYGYTVANPSCAAARSAPVAGLGENPECPGAGLPKRSYC